MSNHLDERLSEGLARSAMNAPVLGCEIADITTLVVKRRRRRANARGALTVVAFAAVVGGLVAIRSTNDGVASTAGRPAVQVESPLTRLAEAPMPFGQVTKPGAIALELADGQHITFAITADVWYDGYGQQTTIQYDNYGTGFGQADDAEVPLIPESELGGTESLTFWTGLPASATRVEYFTVSGEGVWQTPVEGLAAFPATSHAADDTLIAYSIDGAEVARISWSATHLVSTGQSDGGPLHYNYSSLPEPTIDVYGPIDVTKIADLDGAETEAYMAFADAMMMSCLGANGDAAWTTCIQTTDAAVKTYLDDLPTVDS
ncbi:MAG: hypothetical protein ABIO83_07050 [Ilumatobacteraceae bacterium]